MKFEQSSEQQESPGTWMFTTMAEITGAEIPKRWERLSDQVKFTKLWRKATPEQRIAFVENTRFSEEVPEYKELVLKRGADYTQMFPTRGLNRSEDLVYYFSPK